MALANAQGCHDVAFTPDAMALWAACGAGVQRYSLESGDITSELGDRPVEAIALHPKGEILASVAANLGPDPEISKRIVLWQLSAALPSQVGVLEMGASITDLAFTADGRYLVAQAPTEAQSTRPGQVAIWDWQRGHAVHRHALLGSAPIAMNPDGTILAGGFRDGLMLERDGTAIEHGILIRQQGGADAVAFGPTGEELVWAGKPPTFPTPVVRLWRVTSLSPKAPPADDRVEADYQTIDLPESDTTGDPVALAREHYGLREFNTSSEEAVTLRMLPDGNIEVTLRLDGLKDDSVRAIRYRLHFTPAAQGRWQLGEVGRQQRCWRGGIDPDEWTTQLCP
ncbi:WD40 repeat domain-containing protein [Vreelandella zhaodongensis]|uniref:WD40 repeat domain-containing protein n=1 Tax=Vreelandella zhaodongensis TaxID=1176240 RepID=UPI003EBEDADC